MRDLVVVPGLRAAYAGVLAANLRHFGPGWECRAHTAEPRPPPGAPRRCAVEVRRGWKWASMLNLTAPLLAPGAPAPPARVLVLLDDVRIPPGFCMACFLRESRGLPVASPRVDNATWPATRGAHCEGGGAGAAGAGAPCPSAYIETYAKLYTRAALRCYLGMLGGGVLGEATQAVGWGYDRCLGAACPAARQYLLSRHRVVHLATSGGPGRLGRLAYAQSRRLQAWVRRRHGRACVPLGAGGGAPPFRPLLRAARTNERPRTKREGRAARPRPVPT